jgi:hypothetical protein
VKDVSEGRRDFMDRKGGYLYLKSKINELAIKSKNKNIRNLNKGMYELKYCYHYIVEYLPKARTVKPQNPRKVRNNKIVSSKIECLLMVAG